jgi:raffinose/stachyose/melibiose transport system substrate-binding protein
MTRLNAQTRRPWLLALITLFALLLAACGGASTPAAPAGEPTSAPAGEAPAAGEPVTLRVLVHQNPPMVEFMNTFNEQFQAKYPNITVDMAVVNANELSTVTQTRLTANDVDVIDIFGFSNQAQPYMQNVTPPNWQTLIDAGLLLDLTDQPFIKNYDEAAIKDAGTYNGKVYQVNLGRVSYSGVYYNKDLFAANNVAVPTTWSELVAACETFKAAGIECMTAGGKDGWPIFVGAYGLIGSIYPDQAELVEGLWTGSTKWNEGKALEMWSRMQTYASEMMEPGASGIAGDAAPGRFASGAVAMFPGGTWYASAIEAAQPDFAWGYIPFPGSDNAEENKFLFGKYDLPERVLGAGQLPGLRQRGGFHPDADGRHARQPHRRRGCTVPRQLPRGLRAVLGRPQGRRRVCQPLCFVLQALRHLR